MLRALVVSAGTRDPFGEALGLAPEVEAAKEDGPYYEPEDQVATQGLPGTSDFRRGQIHCSLPKGLDISMLKSHRPGESTLTMALNTRGSVGEFKAVAHPVSPLVSLRVWMVTLAS